MNYLYYTELIAVDYFGVKQIAAAKLHFFNECERWTELSQIRARPLIVLEALTLPSPV